MIACVLEMIVLRAVVRDNREHSWGSSLAFFAGTSLADQRLTRIRIRPIIRVFISSTFSDFKFERDALQRRSFPSLELHCQQNGFQFQAIDLRWGVSTEAGLDQRTMQICFNELRRSQEASPLPNFLVLLGNRYGWQPLPERISSEQFQQLEDTARQLPRDDLEAGSPVEVLRAWYRRDDNNLPPVYLMQSLIGTEFERDPQRWQQVERILRRIIDQSFLTETMGADRFRRLPMPEPVRFEGPPFPEIVRFLGSATEQEIWGGVLSIERPDEHVLACFRDIENVDEVELAIASGQRTAHGAGEYLSMIDGRIDPQRHAWQEQLKEEIRGRLELDAEQANPDHRYDLSGAKLSWQRSEGPPGDHVAHWGLDVSAAYRNRVDEMCDWVTARLTSIIDQQIREWRTPQTITYATSRELEIEAAEHTRFCESLANNFVGRDEPGGPLERIRAYLHSDSRVPYVVHGLSGSGKSALLARAFQGARSEEQPPGDQGLIRFLGVTPRTSQLRSLLINLCVELRQRQQARPAAMPTEVHELQQEFRNLLSLASAERPVVLFLDALDQLSDADGSLQLHWLPGGASDPLPEHVKIVVSCLSHLDEHDPAAEPYYQLQKRGLIHAREALEPLSQVEAEVLLFERWLRQAGRTFEGTDENQQAQRRMIQLQLAGEDRCRHPLYLKLLFEEIKRWHSWETPEVPGASVEELLEKLVARLSDHANHGELLVERTLGYLSASRCGLSETEILEILFADAEFKGQLDRDSERNQHVLPNDPPRIPIAIWARLRTELEPYLAERSVPGASVLAFYHRQIASWMTSRFLNELTWGPHGRLAKYFRGKADPNHDFTWQGSSRAQQELPYHLWKAEGFEELFTLSRDLNFWNAQLISSPADPQVALQTLRFAILGSLSAGQMAHAAEFALTYSKRLQLLDDESPLTSLDQHGVRRALAMANLRPTGESILWHLLIAWKFKDLGRLSEMQWVLTQVRDRPATQLPHAIQAHVRLIVSQVPEIFSEPFSYLAVQWLGEDMKLCELVARGEHTSTAVAIASHFTTRLWQGQAFLMIAKQQQRLQSPVVLPTLDLAVQAFAESEPKRETAIIELVEIAGLQRAAGEKTRAAASLQLAARLAEQIPYSAPRVLALSEVAKAEALAGNVDQAFRIWAKAAESATQSGDPEAGVQLLVLIARTLAEAEQHTESQFAFDWTLKLASTIPQPPIPTSVMDKWLNHTSHYFKPLTSPDGGTPLAIHVLIGQLRLEDYEAAKQTARAMPDPLQVSLFLTHIAAELQHKELWQDSAQVLEEIRQLAASVPEPEVAPQPAAHSVKTILFHYMGIAQSRFLQRYIQAHLNVGNFDVAGQWVGHIRWTVARAETLAAIIAAYATHDRREEAQPYLSELEQMANAEQAVIIADPLWEALALSHAVLKDYDRAIAASSRNRSGSGHLKTIGDILALAVPDKDPELQAKLVKVLMETEVTGPMESILQGGARDFAQGIRAIKLAEQGDIAAARRLIDDLPEDSKRSQFRKWLCEAQRQSGQILDAFSTLAVVVMGSNYVANPDAFHQKYVPVVRTEYPTWDQSEQFNELFCALCDNHEQEALRTTLGVQFLNAPTEWSANELFKRFKDLGEQQTRSALLEQAEVSLQAARRQAEQIEATRTREFSIEQIVEDQIATGNLAPALQLVDLHRAKPDHGDISLLCKIAKQQQAQGQGDAARETLRIACGTLPRIPHFNMESAAQEIGCCAVALGEIPLARDILDELQRGTYFDAEHDKFLKALSNWGSNSISREALGIGESDELRKAGRLAHTGPVKAAADDDRSESIESLATDLAKNLGSQNVEEAFPLISLIGSAFKKCQAVCNIVKAIANERNAASRANLERLLEFVQVEFPNQDSDTDAIWEALAVGFVKQGELERGLQLLEHIGSRLFQGTACSEIAEVLEKDGERDQAIEFLHRAGELMSDSQVNSFWLEPVCLKLFRLGDQAGAISFANMLHPQSGEEPLARRARLLITFAETALKENDQTAAVQLLQLARTAAEGEGSSHEFAEALSAVAVFASRMGRVAEAEALFDRALARACDSHHPSSAYYNIATDQLRAGRARGGLDTLQMITEIRDNYAIQFLEAQLMTHRDDELLQRLVPECLGSPRQSLELCSMLARSFPEHAPAIVAHMDRICSVNA